MYPYNFRAVTKMLQPGAGQKEPQPGCPLKAEKARPHKRSHPDELSSMSSSPTVLHSGSPRPTPADVRKVGSVPPGHSTYTQPFPHMKLTAPLQKRLKKHLANVLLGEGFPDPSGGCAEATTGILVLSPWLWTQRSLLLISHRTRH